MHNLDYALLHLLEGEKQSIGTRLVDFILQQTMNESIPEDVLSHWYLFVHDVLRYDEQ
jgi:hypothetical protein